MTKTPSHPSGDGAPLASGLAPADLLRLETLPMRARIIVDGALSGLHRARLRGSSVEFEQHKEYSPGDEIRHIDWKTYAKADRYYVKQFEQESELAALVVLDSSASMSYRGAGIAKLDYAATLAAALSHLLIRQRDKVGLLAFGDQKKEIYVPPRARPQHLHDIHAVLEEVTTRGGQGDETATPSIARAIELCGRRRMMVVVLSDLFDAGGVESGLGQLRARGHDVVVFQTLDRHELELPFDGLTVFEALESDQRLITQPHVIRKEYQKRLRAFLSSIQTNCKDSGIEYHQVVTDTPFEHVLRDFLETRLASRRRLA